MSTRTGRWILVIGLLIFALYAAYPPMRVALRQERIVEKEAETAEEAAEHGVNVGESYIIESETVMRRFLPLALGERSEDVRVLELREDGSVLKERTEYVEGRIKRGLDVAGGTELIYELRAAEAHVDFNIRQIIDILRRRIDPQNIKEYVIQPAGENRILIQVPEATQAEVAALKDRITRMGRLEFRIGLPRTEEYAREYSRADEGIIEPGYMKMHIDGDPENPFYLIRTGDPEITGEYLQNVGVGRDQRGQIAIDFRFNPEGGRMFARITSRHQGMLLGAVLDGVLQSAPVIQTTIRERGQITGRFTREEVDNLIAVLHAGSLPMDLDILQETTVGPQLGRDSIRRGLRSILIAGALVMLIMAGYYLACGFVADAVILLNLTLLAGVLGLLGATLTLPGLAGILLTVGMTVDANVLIFERIREETLAGKSVPVALRNGYEKAFSTIIDADITTLLTAIILYMVGTGPVRGFAVTLSAGIVLSLFNTLYVGRLFFETLVARDWIKSFRMNAFFKQPGFSYTKFRKAGYAASITVLAVGLGVLALRGRDMLDVDFTGGTLVHLNFAEPVPADVIRSRLIEGGYPNPHVQGVGRTDARGSAEFRVRIPGAGTERIEEQIKPGIIEKLEGAGLAAERVSAGRDGRSLTLKLDREIDEMELRRALAPDPENPFEIEHIHDIVTAGDPGIEKVAIHVRDTGFRTADELMLEALRLLHRVGADSGPVLIEVSEPAEDADEDGPHIIVTTAQPLDRRVFKRGLLDLNIEGITVDSPQVISESFTVAGPAEELRKLADGRVDFIKADLTDRTVSAVLTEPVRRQAIVLRAEQDNIRDNIIIASMGYKADTYTLGLDERSIRANIEAIFAGLGIAGGVQVTYDLRPADEAGKVLASFRFDEPVGDDAVEYRLRDTGMEPGLYLQTDIAPGTATSHIELLLPEDRAEAMAGAVVSSFTDASPVSQTTSIGAVVAGEMQGRALLAIICASLIIVIYVGIRFHAVKFGVAAVIALLHDVAITAGIVALADTTGLFGDVKINLPMLAAFLTIIGYSLNDSIVVFDRIRENTIKQGRKLLSAELIDLSINQTLSRTLMTSITTLTVVLVLYIFGGVALQGLAFTLIVGVAVGTYSSIFIASPIVLDWQPMVGGLRVFFRILLFPVRAPFMLVEKLT